MQSVPIADLHPFITSPDIASKRTAAETIASHLRAHGYVGIKGHGIPQEILNNAFDVMHKFFDLPLADKMTAPHPDTPTPHRGYLAAGVEKSGNLGAVYASTEAEKAFLRSASDWKETFDIGSPANTSQPNIWPPASLLPSFQPTLLTLYTHLTTLSAHLLEALMLSLDLSASDRATLRNMHDPHEPSMRLAHYLPLSAEQLRDASVMRIAPHRDFSSFTLLVQESVGGLEFEERRGTGAYVCAVPRDGVVYLNIGDVFERLSNGVYPSPLHRISKPAGALEGGEDTIPSRYSIPFFVNIRPDAVIRPMPSRVERDGGEARFAPISYMDMCQELFTLTQPRGVE
ncbi:Clavaminate synthase-like protein [Pseudovirgaria hyperparasitica]|uniref:Clavaminate synthase-like protein n=1 Tax=Pseudovirgaria hyperparasitica TaxID=470096 RepID=A0A6A6VTJ3_9PEZI|nr:Clavaminate synthase-like protein [Pseudovirgaria hyperparasitica]KAF2753533.1 Clavaminate synthase-like protein [Pseudovirgaria hyperparasitica]